LERGQVPGPAPGPRSRWQPSERVLVFLLAAVAYVALSAYLLLYRNGLFVDALARTANAQYVISSRDPHLAAIGFVWNPLPSLLMVPFIPLRLVWPELISTGMIAGIESALFMAGTVGLVRGTLADLGVGRGLRLVLTAAFALHPMIVLYGINGMSEAMLLFFAVLSGRSLLQWLTHRTTRPLVITGLALAFAYLTRYEALAPGAAIVGLVLVVSAFRAAGSLSQRRTAALTDAGLVGLPFVFSFAIWAVLNKVIVRQWFPTLNSEYGNTAQVALDRTYIDNVIGRTTNGRLDYVGHQLFGLEPLVAGLVALTLLLGALRRDLRVLAPLAAIASVLAFDVAATVTGRSFGWLRFSIAVVPLAVLLAGVLVSQAGPRRWLRLPAGIVACALVLPGVFTAGSAMLDRKLGREESLVLTAEVNAKNANLTELVSHRRFDFGPKIAAFVEAAHYGRGRVLTDAASAFPILLWAKDPSAYVITPDQDFARVLADPATFKVHYLLLPDPQRSGADALNTAYPTLFESGWPGGRLVHEWKSSGMAATWRLYELPAGVPI
jgi:hypothetical protein